MKNILTHPPSALRLSLLLCLPFLVFVLITGSQIEPFLSLLKSVILEANGHSISRLGYLIKGLILLCVPAAFTISLLPVVREWRAGGRLLAHPTHLLIGITLLSLMAFLLRYWIPCWLNLPNCD